LELKEFSEKRSRIFDKTEKEKKRKNMKTWKDGWFLMLIS
jgi:hypothetical protein